MKMTLKEKVVELILLSRNMTTDEDSSIQWEINEGSIVPTEIEGTENPIGQLSVGPKPSPLIVVFDHDAGVCLYLQVSSEGTVGVSAEVYLVQSDTLEEDPVAEIYFQDILDDQMLEGSLVTADGTAIQLSTVDLTPQKAYLAIATFNTVLQILTNKVTPTE